MWRRNQSKRGWRKKGRAHKVLIKSYVFCGIFISFWKSVLWIGRYIQQAKILECWLVWEDLCKESRSLGVWLIPKTYGCAALPMNLSRGMWWGRNPEDEISGVFIGQFQAPIVILPKASQGCDQFHFFNSIPSPIPVFPIPIPIPLLTISFNSNSNSGDFNSNSNSNSGDFKSQQSQFQKWPVDVFLEIDHNYTNKVHVY